MSNHPPFKVQHILILTFAYFLISSCFIILLSNDKMMGDPNMEIILDESLRNQTVATTNVNSMKYFTREANGEKKQRFISLDEVSPNRE